MGHPALTAAKVTDCCHPARQFTKPICQLVQVAAPYRMGYASLMNNF